MITFSLICISAHAANEQEAINQYLSKDGMPCLRLRDWPVKLSWIDLEQNKIINSKAAKMAALEQQNLVVGENQPDKGKVYQLSSTGKKYIANSDLCFGKKTLKDIISIDGKESSQERDILFTYNLTLNDWAKSKEIQTAFPLIASTVEGAGKSKQRQVLVKDPNGWHIKVGMR
jgi:hypothetical protein